MGETFILIQKRRKRTCKNTKMRNPKHTSFWSLEIIAHEKRPRWPWRKKQTNKELSRAISKQTWSGWNWLESTPTIGIPPWRSILRRLERTSWAKWICVVKRGETPASVGISSAANWIEPRQTVVLGEEHSVIHAKWIEPCGAVKDMLLTVPRWKARAEQWRARYRVCKKGALLFLLEQAIRVGWVYSNRIQTQVPGIKERLLSVMLMIRVLCQNKHLEWKDGKGKNLHSQAVAQLERVMGARVKECVRSSSQHRKTKKRKRNEPPVTISGTLLLQRKLNHQILLENNPSQTESIWSQFRQFVHGLSHIHITSALNTVESVWFNHEKQERGVNVPILLTHTTY